LRRFDRDLDDFSDACNSVDWSEYGERRGSQAKVIECCAMSRYHTWSHFGASPSIGLTSFMVDIAGALVSPRMSAPKLLDFRARGMVKSSVMSKLGE
jgi:hypothetical protein